MENLGFFDDFQHSLVSTLAEFALELQLNYKVQESASQCCYNVLVIHYENGFEQHIKHLK